MNILLYNNIIINIILSLNMKENDQNNLALDEVKWFAKRFHIYLITYKCCMDLILQIYIYNFENDENQFF